MVSIFLLSILIQVNTSIHLHYDGPGVGHLTQKLLRVQILSL